MPTARQRYQVTETPAVAHALDVAARRWPDEPRSRLLVRLINTGGRTLEQDEDATQQARTDAIADTSGRYGEVFDETYLGRLREDWPQ